MANPYAKYVTDPIQPSEDAQSVESPQVAATEAPKEVAPETPVNPYAKYVNPYSKYVQNPQDRPKTAKDLVTDENADPNQMFATNDPSRFSPDSPEYKNAQEQQNLAIQLYRERQKNPLPLHLGKVIENVGEGIATTAKAAAAAPVHLGTYATLKIDPSINPELAQHEELNAIAGKAALKNMAYDPNTGELAPQLTEMVRKGIQNVGDKFNGAPQTDDEIRTRLEANSQNIRQVQKNIQDGIAEMESKYGQSLTPEAKDEYVKEVAAQSSITDPTTLAFLGAGRTFSALGKISGKAFKLASEGIETASEAYPAVASGVELAGQGKAIIGNAANTVKKAIKTYVGVPLEGTGKVLGAGVKWAKTPVGAGTIIGTGTALYTGDPMKGLEAGLGAAATAGVLSFAKKIRLETGLPMSKLDLGADAVDSVSRGMQNAGRKLQGLPGIDYPKQMMLYGETPTISSRIGDGIKYLAKTDTAKGAASGAVMSLPLLLSSENPDEAATVLLTGAAFGAIGGATDINPNAMYRKSLAKKIAALAPESYGAVVTDANGANLPLDQWHAKNIKGMTSDQKLAVNAQRGMFPGAQIYVLTPEQMASLGIKGRGAYDPAQIQTSATIDGQPQKIILIDKSLAALNHETGHYIFDQLSPDEKNNVYKLVGDNVPESVLKEAYVKYVRALASDISGTEITDRHLNIDKDGNLIVNQKRATPEIADAIKKAQEYFDKDPSLLTQEYIAEQFNSLAKGESVAGQAGSGKSIRQSISDVFDEVRQGLLGFTDSPKVQDAIRDAMGQVYRERLAQGKVSADEIAPAAISKPLESAAPIPVAGANKTPNPTPENPIILGQSDNEKAATIAAKKLKFNKDKILIGLQSAKDKGITDVSGIVKEIFSVGQTPPVRETPATLISAIPEKPLSAAEPIQPENKNSVPTADTPSPNFQPRSEQSVEPRPTKQTGGNDWRAKKDEWDDQYGDMRKGGRSHNDDGTPYQPTVYDEVQKKATNGWVDKTDQQRRDSTGSDSDLTLGSALKDLINDGWIWDDNAGKMVNPNNPNERPIDGLNRIREPIISNLEPQMPGEPIKGPLSEDARPVVTPEFSINGPRTPTQIVGGPLSNVAPIGTNIRVGEEGTPKASIEPYKRTGNSSNVRLLNPEDIKPGLRVQAMHSKSEPYYNEEGQPILKDTGHLFGFGIDKTNPTEVEALNKAAQDSGNPEKFLDNQSKLESAIKNGNETSVTYNSAEDSNAESSTSQERKTAQELSDSNIIEKKPVQKTITPNGFVVRDATEPIFTPESASSAKERAASEWTKAQKKGGGLRSNSRLASFDSPEHIGQAIDEVVSANKEKRTVQGLSPKQAEVAQGLLDTKPVKRFDLTGYSQDKVIANTKNLIQSLKDSGVADNPDIKREVDFMQDSKDLAQTIRDRNENHAKGYRGDGEIFRNATGGDAYPQKKGTPVKIPDWKIQVINALEGGTSPSYWLQAVANDLTSGRKVPVDPVKESSNAFYKKLVDLGDNLFLNRGDKKIEGVKNIIAPASETLRLDRIESTGKQSPIELPPSSYTQRAAGFMPRGALSEVKPIEERMGLLAGVGKKEDRIKFAEKNNHLYEQDRDNFHGKHFGDLYELMESVTSPSGVTIKDIRPTSGGSLYYKVEFPTASRDEYGDTIYKTEKISIRNHEASPLREKQFGENDHEIFIQPKQAKGYGAHAPEPELIEYAKALNKLEDYIHEQAKDYAIRDVVKEDSANRNRYWEEKQSQLENDLVKNLDVNKNDLQSAQDNFVKNLRPNGKPINTDYQREQAQLTIQRLQDKIVKGEEIKRGGQKQEDSTRYMPRGGKDAPADYLADWDLPGRGKVKLYNLNQDIEGESMRYDPSKGIFTRIERRAESPITGETVTKAWAKKAVELLKDDDYFQKQNQKKVDETRTFQGLKTDLPRERDIRMYGELNKGEGVPLRQKLKPLERDLNQVPRWSEERDARRAELDRLAEEGKGLLSPEALKQYQDRAMAEFASQERRRQIFETALKVGGGVATLLLAMGATSALTPDIESMEINPEDLKKYTEAEKSFWDDVARRISVNQPKEPNTKPRGKVLLGERISDVEMTKDYAEQQDKLAFNKEARDIYWKLREKGTNADEAAIRAEGLAKVRLKNVARLDREEAKEQAKREDAQSAEIKAWNEPPQTDREWVISKMVENGLTEDQAKATISTPAWWRQYKAFLNANQRQSSKPLAGVQAPQ